jgi:16S rRNA (guanine966-N2)-methyltransferase
VRGDVTQVLTKPELHGLSTPYDVITVTPPYEEVIYGQLIEALSTTPLVREDTIVVIEYPVELGCLPHVIGNGRFVGLRNRRYGRTVLGIYICRPSGRLDLADSRPEEFISLKKQKSMSTRPA